MEYYVIRVKAKIRSAKSFVERLNAGTDITQSEILFILRLMETETIRTGAKKKNWTSESIFLIQL